MFSVCVSVSIPPHARCIFFGFDDFYGYSIIWPSRRAECGVGQPRWEPIAECRSGACHRVGRLSLFAARVDAPPRLGGPPGWGRGMGGSKWSIGTGLPHGVLEHEGTVADSRAVGGCSRFASGHSSHFTARQLLRLGSAHKGAEEQGNQSRNPC